MLATRSYDAEQSHWPFGKFFPSPRTPSAGSRMSENYDHPLPSQSDWQGQYPYLSQTGASIYPHQAHESSHATTGMTHTHTGGENETLRLGAIDGARAALPGLGNHHPLGSQGGQPAGHVPGSSATNKGNLYGTKTTDHLSAAMGPAEAAGHSAASVQPNSISSLIQSSNPSRGHGSDDNDNPIGCSKEGVDQILDEDDVIEAEQEPAQPQTTAERVAARRKMKRFRLTHQQTRFLSSEFAKQPHPDAAHRERLSREIPGLSPRQVQVWFQNRRAKIKRHNAEDRERMIKMRAVPDDFDNVQALHSPYGAMNMPLAPPVDFTNPSYANPMMRPLMVDVRRHDGGEQISPTGVASSYSNIGYSPSTGIHPPGGIAHHSPGPSDRYTHSGHPTSALGGSHGPLDSGLQASRSAVRPIQPFSMRDVMSRPRSESLQSPLRPGIPWKTESMDYYVYGGLNSTSQSMPDRTPLGYQSGPAGQTASGGIGGLDRSSYSGSSTTQPSPGLHYSPFPSASQAGSRLRAASASSVSLGIEHTYRDMSSGLHSPGHAGHAGHGRPAASSAHFSGPSAYTTNYTTASVAAPLDNSQTRPSSNVSNMRDYPDTSLHVSTAPASEFPQMMQSSMGGVQETRSEVRELFHNGSMEYNNSHHRQDHYSGDLSGTTFKRERSYTLTGSQAASVGDARTQPHGSTA